MSDSEESTVTYTTVSSPYEGRSGDVSPGVDGPPVMPKDPYAYIVAAFQALPPPDYVPGPEEPEQAPPSLVYIPYVSEPVYLEYIPPEDDVFPAEEQPLPVATSPTAKSPGYIPEFDPDKDPEEDDDEDLGEDPADYPVDYDDEEEEEEPSGADTDEEDEEISLRPQPPTRSFTKEDAKRFLAMWKRIRLKRDKSKQNRTKTGSVAKPRKIKSSLSGKMKKNQRKQKKNGRKRMHGLKVIKLLNKEEKLRAKYAIPPKFKYKGQSCQFPDTCGAKDVLCNK
nr:hypothetical protein [Tanacetum cinerariifolium]